MSARVPPHNLEAERAVLGAVLIDNGEMASVASVLRPDDFYRAAHGRIYAALLDLFKDRYALDLVVLKERLLLSGHLEDVGGPAYVASLIDGVPHTVNVSYYASIVADKARLRAAIGVLDKATVRAYEAEDSVSVIADAVTEGLARAAGNGHDLGFADDAVLEYFKSVVGGTLPTPTPTGFVDLDRMLKGGLRPGEVAIVAGRPGMGKTALGVQVAEHAAARGHTSVVFSLEMSRQQVAARLLAQRARVPYAVFEAGEMTDAQAQNVSAATEKDRVPMWLECRSRTALDVWAWCRQLRQRNGGLGVAVIDYIQLLQPERHKDSSEAEMSGISRTLKQIARDLDTAVVAISQLNRAPEGRKDKRPTMADLRGSGALEQDCSVGLLVHRPEVYGVADTEGIAEVIVGKNRNGAIGVCRMAFLKDLTMFADLAADAD